MVVVGDRDSQFLFGVVAVAIIAVLAGLTALELRMGMRADDVIFAEP